HLTKDHCKGADIARQRDRVEEPLDLRTHVSHALSRPEAASQAAVPPAAVLSCRFGRVRGFPYPPHPNAGMMTHHSHPSAARNALFTGDLFDMALNGRAS